MADNILIRYQADISQIKAKLNELEREMASTDGKISKSQKGVKSSVDASTKSVNTFSGTLGRVGGLVAGAFAVGAIVSFGKSIINTAGYFQKFEAVLTNTLGSKSEAQKALLLISNFASKTPFQVDELTESFIKFANRGIVLTQSEMIKLADIAASQGKSFNQLTEAVLDAQTGEFERLKEFGIRAKSSGDTVQLSFKGVTKEVVNTSTAIQEAVLGFGELNGVLGTTASISKTIPGQLSNIGDDYDQLLNLIGKGNSDTINTAISLVATYVNFLKESLKSVEDLRQEGIAASSGASVDFFKQESAKGREALLLGKRLRLLEVDDILKTSKIIDADRKAQFELERRRLIEEIKSIISFTGQEKDAKQKAAESQAELDRKNREKALKEAAEANKKFRQDQKDQDTIFDLQRKEIVDKRLGEIPQELAKELQIREDFNNLTLLSNEELYAEIFKAEQEGNAKRLEALKLEEEQRLGIIRDSADEEDDIRQGMRELAEKALFAGFEITQNLYAQDLINLQDQLDNKQISQEEFDRKSREIKKKQFELDRQAAITKTIIDTASAVAEALPNIPLSIIAGALGAIELGVILSQPIPKFNKGIIGIKRGKNPAGVDTIPAMLDEGESVIKTQATNKYRDELLAINNLKLEELIYKKYITPELEKFGLAGTKLNINASLKDGNIVSELRENTRVNNKILSVLASQKTPNTARRRLWN